MDWEGKNVLVTGVSGFVGSWLSDTLVERGSNLFSFKYSEKSFSNFDYLNLSKRSEKVIKGSVTDLELLKRTFKKNDIDTCFHLAAQTIVGVGMKSPLLTFKVNIEGTWNILESCRQSNAIERVIIASSDKAYGAHEKLPYKEDYALLPAEPYSTSKACADILSQLFGKFYGLPIGIVRPANIFGGGDFNFSRIVPSISKDIIFNKRPEITTQGRAIRDFIYISDMIDAYLTLAQKLDDKKVRGEPFNFSGENKISILELVKKMIEVSNKDLEPKILGTRNEEKEIDEQYLNCEKAKRLLGWKPKTPLKEGIKKSLDWYEDFFNSDFYKKAIS
ncbi:MAG: NAD-dependent epimerase/dehydratase family protein [Candidatus Aenigmarchaeota archaeon]|nr:NAD-dependent epimerase/dehydratase family protein [Candidatus Aenigmarchaeota archaeon]